MKNSAGTADALNIYMVYSGGYKLFRGHQDLIEPDQIEWYKTKSEELKTANGGEPCRRFCFSTSRSGFYSELMTEVPAGTEGAMGEKGAAAGKPGARPGKAYRGFARRAAVCGG